MNSRNKCLTFPNELAKVFTIIINNQGTCRLIGGCVRDYLINRPIEDFDIATDLTPEKTIKLLSQVIF